jgi:predicted ATPase with chaperone activity
MSDSAQDALLAKLATLTGAGENRDPWSRLAATEPQHVPARSRGTEAPKEEERIDELLQKIGSLAKGATARPAPDVPTLATSAPDDFFPVEPDSIRQAGLTESQVEALILKYLLARGCCKGREAADQVRLPFKLIDPLMRQMKTDQLVVYSASAPMNDYEYQLTEVGRERARRYSEECTYFGAAPVTLNDYIASVTAQSLTKQHPTVHDLRVAFGDLLINKKMLDRLGPAINSGRGLFLYGAPGNGKTSIAERVTKAFGPSIWIPRAIGVDGDIMRMFDPSNHEELPLETPGGLLDQRKLDKRWIRIRRPTIVVGGELTMDNLEVMLNKTTGISEAPLQMKSNCGTLVIDDFGRQRMRTDELLNRWIVPLEKRYDFLNMPGGKKIQVPFDQLIIFSTNLQPKDLVDDAFLRRIPYKIDVTDPSVEEFHELFRLMAPKFGIVYREEVVNYLIDKHYRKVNRPLRCCQPRDLLLQIRNYCYYQNVPPDMTEEYFDFAVANYFAVM